MKPWLDDGDVRLYHGHTLDVLRAMPDASADCIITSPPYYGLRDYGTGRWEDGDNACDHLAPLGGGTGATGLQRDGRSEAARQGNAERIVADRRQQYRDECGKCGARRVDDQIGIEASPAAYLDTLVSVFREARRVLADHGTCWVNLGDSYVSNFASGLDRKSSWWSSGSGEKEGVSSHDLDAAIPANQMRKRSGLAVKNLLGMPWRLALALQDDGWILRRDIVWSKPNPMPESVTDRCTSAHEYVFHLTKRPVYWYDQDAICEPNQPDGRKATGVKAAGGSIQHRDGERWPNPAGRNARSVWEIATQPTPEAHFATYPEELVRRCLLAGCPLEVCRECGKPRERITREQARVPARNGRGGGYAEATGNGQGASSALRDGGTYPVMETIGWSDCGHGSYRRGVVLDPFIGSGTTARVARNHGRHAIGIDLNLEYLGIASRRLAQLGLLAGV